MCRRCHCRLESQTPLSFEHLRKSQPRCTSAALSKALGSSAPSELEKCSCLGSPLNKPLCPIGKWGCSATVFLQPSSCHQLLSPMLSLIKKRGAGSNRTRGNGFRLKEERFRLYVGKEFFPARVARLGTGCPLKLWQSHPWKRPRPGGTGPGAPWDSGRCPWMNFMVPSDSNQPMILYFFHCPPLTPVTHQTQVSPHSPSTIFLSVPPNAWIHPWSCHTAAALNLLP